MILASRFKRNGTPIYTKVERGRDGLLGPDLTWRTAKGVIAWGRYFPLFFWRRFR